MNKSRACHVPFPAGGIPQFFLYGEPPRHAPEGFLHAETIPERSRLHDWRIGAHAHADLHQLLLVSGGRGELRLEGSREPFEAPAVLIIPATRVHAFDFEPDTRGYVISLAEAALEPLGMRERALRRLFAAPRCLALSAEAAARAELELDAQRLLGELNTQAPARRLAAAARLTTLLVGVLRQLSGDDGVMELRDAAGPRWVLVGQFRALIERRFRSGWRLEQYARELCVSGSRLRAACLEVTGKPPIRLLHERVLLEAERLLAYGEASIAEVAYALGFTDPAYFSRFFTVRAGESPAAFRRRRIA